MWKPQTKEAVLREVRIREWRKRIGKAIMLALKLLVTSSARGIICSLSWLKWQTAKLAHEIETNRLLSQRYDKLLQLGETVYAMYRAGQTSWHAVEPLCQEIDQIERKLDAAKMKSLRFLTYKGEGQEESVTSSIASQ